jgi:hypothetical protein
MNLTFKAVERAWLATRRSRHSASKSIAEHAYILGDCPRVFRAKHAYIPRDCPGKAHRLNLLGNRLNLLLKFLDLRFVTGDEGLDKVASWLGFR